MTEPQLITRAEAIDAIHRCAFTIPADEHDAGRSIVHSFAGGGGLALGCDMDTASAIDAVETCLVTDDVPQVAWMDTLFGRCLCFIRADGRMLRLDTVTP